MEKVPNGHHDYDDLLQKLATGFKALLDHVQDLESQLSHAIKEAQIFLRPETPLTCSSSSNSFHSHEKIVHDMTVRRSRSQPSSLGLTKRLQAIMEGRQALAALKDRLSFKMPSHRPKDTQLSQPGLYQHGTGGSKPAAMSVRGVNPNEALKCPFASLKTVISDPITTWSPYESITPRPDCINPPHAHHLPSLQDASSDQQKTKCLDEPNPSEPDHQARLSSLSSFYFPQPTSLAHKDLSIEDPIAAELKPVESRPPPSASGSVSASKCPIRFMDQHSPEEIAVYFENHKHEIPRSHEICVKRYQSNKESIRQLDAKYGDLVSMIQGLGMKHQPLLPAEDDNMNPNTDQCLLERVEKWTDEIKDAPEASKPESPDHLTDIRENHFDRPLKDVRLGESPSRPWGISVPIAKNLSKASASPSRAGNFSTDNIKPQKHENFHSEDSFPPNLLSHIPTAPNHLRPTLGYFCPDAACGQPSRTMCPTLHQLAAHILTAHVPETQQQSPLSPSASSQSQKPAHVPASSSSQMIFTGPVFIGYPPDQAAAVLQQSGRKGK